MAWQKTYITWTRFLATSNLLIDPTHSVDNLWGFNANSERQLKIQELPFGNIAGDLRMLAIVEWDDSVIDTDNFNKFMSNYSYHCFYQITASDALALCNKWYPAPQGEDPYISLDADGFTLIDDRPGDV